LEKTPPLSIELQLKSIQQLIQTAKFNDAITQGHQLLEGITDIQHQTDIWYLIAVAQRYAKSFADAFNSIQALLELSPSHSRAYQEQGYINLALNQQTKATFSFEQAVALNPSLVASWQELIQLYREKGQQEQVQKVANQLAKLKALPPALLAVT